MDKYYSLPLDLKEFITNHRGIPACTEVESINSHLGLLITTCPGEHKFDKDWGCNIWDFDFEKITSSLRWEMRCAEQVLDMAKKYEPRLKDITVEVHVNEVNTNNATNDPPSVKKKVNLYFNATLVSTGKPYHFLFQLYLGPIVAY